MRRGISILLSMVAGLLVGCATGADPPPSGTVPANAPATSEPTVITPGALAEPGLCR